jgi:hypothetical protein
MGGSVKGRDERFEFWTVGIQCLAQQEAKSFVEIFIAGGNSKPVMVQADLTPGLEENK